MFSDCSWLTDADASQDRCSRISCSHRTVTERIPHGMKFVMTKPEAQYACLSSLAASFWPSGKEGSQYTSKDTNYISWQPAELEWIDEPNGAAQIQQMKICWKYFTPGCGNQAQINGNLLFNYHWFHWQYQTILGFFLISPITTTYRKNLRVAFNLD